MVPILVYPSEAKCPSQWLTGGTGMLVRSNQNRFLITADHVIKEIERLQGERLITVMTGGEGHEMRPLLIGKPIDRDDSVDICTLQISDEFDPVHIGKQFLEFPAVPARRAAVGEAALILGYASGHREGGENWLKCRWLPVHDFITESGPRRFTLADEVQERQIIRNPENLSFPEHLGGMSGSPVFRSESGRLTDFIGIFVEGAKGINGMLFASHADFVLPDGSLDFAKIPPKL